MARQVKLKSPPTEKQGTRTSGGTLMERVESDHSKPKLLRGQDMENALVGMITSRTERFVEVEEMHKRVPSKHVSDERKHHRLDTKELRNLFREIQESPYLDIEQICREMRYDIPHERVQKLVASVSLPKVFKGPRGVPTALKRRDQDGDIFQ